MILSLISLLILIITWFLIIAIAIIVYTSFYFNNFWRGFLAYYSEIFYQIRNIPTTITFLNYIFKKYLRNSIITFITISIFISFYNDIIMIMDKYWVKSIITHLNKHTFLQYTLLNGPLIIEYAYSFYYKSKPKKIHIIILILLTSLYYSDYWIFLNSLNLFIITYWLLELSYLFIFFHDYGKKKDNKSIFIIDSPLKPNNKNEKDSLGREHLIKTSAENLRNSFFKQGAFYVAVTGEWGSGKTSFTNILTDKMISDEKDIIKIEINTWRTEDPNLFTKCFFDTLNKELSIYIPELSKLLPKYLAIVANSCDNKYLKGASKILDSFSNNNNDPYESIKKVLIKAKKKIIVVIDDIDRLNAEEIYQILKLVRNTVDFPYMQFIMNFDKEYVVDCLGKYICDDTRNVIKIDNKKLEDRKSNSKNFNTDTQNKKAQNYLEKFIQIEIYLTPFESSTIPRCFYELLCDNGYKSIADELKGLIERNYSTEDLNNTSEGFIIKKPEDIVKDYKNITLLGETISSMRSLKKLYNSFINSYLTINKTNIGFKITHLFLIELLKLHDIEIYKLLLKNPASILITSKDNHDKLFYYLEEDLPNTINEISKEIINYLFSSKNPSKSSIQYLSNFDNYFYLRNSKSIITYSEIFEVLSAKNLNAKTKINEWKNNMSENGICYRIREFIKIFDNKKHSDLYKKLCNFIYELISNKIISANNLLPDYSTYIFNNTDNFKDNFKYHIRMIENLIENDYKIIEESAIENFCKQIKIWIGTLNYENNIGVINDLYSFTSMLIINTKLKIPEILNIDYGNYEINSAEEYKIHFSLLKDAYIYRKDENLKDSHYNLLWNIIIKTHTGKSYNNKDIRNQFFELIKEYLSDNIFLSKCIEFNDLSDFLLKNEIYDINSWDKFILCIYIERFNYKFITIYLYLYIQKEVNYKNELRDIIAKVINKFTFENMLKENNQYISDCDESDLKEINKLKDIYNRRGY